MTDKKKIEILLNKIDRLSKENETLKKQLSDLPTVKQLFCELEAAKKEYNTLITELHKEIDEYKSLNTSLCTLKKKYKTSMTKAVKEVYKITK